MKKLIIISGISGTGKTTLAKKMYQKIENQLEEDAYEPDKDAFLTDEEWRDMYGYCKK